MDLASLTGATNYFEDFEVGAVIKHARGKTITPLENVLITNLVMNTAAGHFNEDVMLKAGAPGIVVYGGVNFSMVLGIASQDCCENAVRELSLDNVRLTKPVRHGDSIYAYTEVLDAKPGDSDDTGILVFRHYGYNQRDELIAQVDRTVLMKRRGYKPKG